MPPTIADLEALLGPSPEDEHRYRCPHPDCENTTEFLGIDDRGLPGDGDRCDRCGRFGTGHDEERCRCPLYVTLEQPFRVTEPGREPWYDAFEGGASGAEIRYYTRIRCMGCERPIWASDEGVAPIVGAWAGWHGADLDDALLVAAVRRDLRGVLDRYEGATAGPAGRAWSAFRAVDGRVWQDAYDAWLAEAFVEPLRVRHHSPALQALALSPLALSVGFGEALRLRPHEAMEVRRDTLAADERPRVDPADALDGIRPFFEDPSGWVRGGLSVLEGYPELRAAVASTIGPLLRPLLEHDDGDVRRRALMLRAQMGEPTRGDKGRDGRRPGR